MEKGFDNSQAIAGRPDGRISPRPRKRLRPGFTLTELAVTAVIGIIVVLAVGTVIADSVRGWQKTYDRVYTDVRDDGFVARKRFDREIRRATRHMYSTDSTETWVEVYYHSVSSTPIVDRYARFYSASGALLLERGTFTPGDASGRSVIGTEIVCQNVASCTFKADGRSAQMILTLDNGTQSLTVATSAVMHNGS